MRYHLLSILDFVFLTLNCSPSNEASSTSLESIDLLEVPINEIEKSKLVFNKFKSEWTLGDSLFSGYSMSYYPEGMVKERIGILNGKKQNESEIYYRDSSYRSYALYHKGKLHGVKKTWSRDSSHTLLSHGSFYLGKAHGVQKKWYPSGELFKVMNMNMGREEGIQQAYRKNGVLYANYEAKEGRIFGLKKAALCYDVDDGNVQLNK